MGRLIRNGTEYSGSILSVNIVNNLESTSINSALSANMGRELNDKLANAIFIKSFDPETGTLETVSADNSD